MWVFWNKNYEGRKGSFYQSHYPRNRGSTVQNLTCLYVRTSHVPVSLFGHRKRRRETNKTKSVRIAYSFLKSWVNRLKLYHLKKSQSLLLLVTGCFQLLCGHHSFQHNLNCASICDPSQVNSSLVSSIHKKSCQLWDLQQYALTVVSSVV